MALIRSGNRLSGSVSFRRSINARKVNLVLVSSRKLLQDVELLVLLSINPDLQALDAPSVTDVTISISIICQLELMPTWIGCLRTET